MISRLCLITILLAFTNGLVLAQTDGMQQLFAEGNAAFADERYDDAVAAYQQAYSASDQSSLALLFNLGNAYYYLQDFPAALLAYERALILEPGNPDVLANLQKIIDQSDLERPQYSIAQEFAYTLPVTTWMLLLMIGSATTILFGLLVWYAPKLAPIPSLGLYLAVPLMLVSIAGLLVWKQDFTRGLITSSNANLQVAPTESANTLSRLSNGTWVEVLETHEPYHYIRTPDKQEGWVTEGSVGKVWP